MIVLIALISGCASTPVIPTVDENDAFMYERKYLVEYENIKASYIDQSVVKWIQPANQKTPCKVYVGISKTEDRTLDDDYKIYWDGSCKNGFANGLGREFERGTVLNMEAIVIYQGMQQEPQYFIQKYHLDNKTQEGDLNNHYFVETTINDDNFNFEVDYKYGYFGSSEAPALITHSSPFYDNIIYYKNYPNFYYILYDMSNNEFEERSYQSAMYHNGKANGFMFDTPKVGAAASVEMTNGVHVRNVILPNSYFTKISQIVNEVNEAGKKALNAQKRALKVKKQYMNRICKKSITVNFIDNEEYKKICNESEYYATLKEKMDEKLAQINQLKQQKLQQLNQQKLANAAQRQADAAAKSASSAEYENITQSWQNLNNNLQMQQLNNNLMFMRMGY